MNQNLSTMSDQEILAIVARLKEQRRDFKIKTKDMVKKLLRGIKEEAKSLGEIEPELSRDIRSSISELQDADQNIILPGGNEKAF
jgi:hypothetical protein